MRKTALITLGITFFAFAAGLFVFRRMPPVMASHWSLSGSVNGYLPRFWGVFAIPILMLFLWVLFLVVPFLGPKARNVAPFREAFDRFIILLFMFLEYIYIITLAWNLHYQFDILRAILPTFAIVFYGIGDLIAATEPNWAVGIRVPWTMNNPVVWKKTHAVGGRLFKYSAIAAAASLLFPEYGLYLVIAPLFATIFILLGYSYYLAHFAFKR